MFGIANQLLAVAALAVATTFLVNMGRARYAPVTVVPMLFVATTTLSAGVLSIRDIFWPLAHQAGSQFRGMLQTVLTAVMLALVVVVLVDAARRCIATMSGRPIPEKAFGPARVVKGVPQRCC
jgi:carbon starvation protein